MAAITGTAADGTRYQITGPDGPAVILVHGLGLTRAMWQQQVPALADRYRVVTYDLFGHGESPPPPQPPSLSLFSDQLHRLMGELALEKVALAGFSLGGMIVRRFALDHPDALWALAILHSPHRRDRQAHDAIQARVHQARREGPAATVDAALARWFSEGFRQRHPAVDEQVRASVLANDRHVYPGIYQVLVDGVTEITGVTWRTRCPVLVMTGDEDFGNSPAMTMAIAREFANARTVILPGLRHLAMLENPDRFNSELLSFLHAAEPGR